MSNYRRQSVPGGTYFFTVTLADRQSGLLVEKIPLLRRAYAEACGRLPFETVAICVLPDHLHAIWTLPNGDSDYSQRWALIKSRFSRALPKATSLSASKYRKREKGYGRGVSGSIRYAMRMILPDTLITSTSIPSSMGWSIASRIGRFPVSIGTLSEAFFR